MAIPFLSDIRLPSSGKVYLWTGHNDNFLKYDLWQASASAGMTIKNIANSGSIIFQTNSTTALTLNSSQKANFAGDVVSEAFTGKLQGSITGAPDQTIWRVSGQYTNWGIFYNEGSPDKIEFKAGGSVTSSIALDNGTISTIGNIITTTNSAVIQTPRISMEADGTLDWGQSRNVGTLTWDTGYAYLKGQASKGVKIQVDNSTTALTFGTDANATFAGNVTTTGVAYTDYIQTRSGTSIDFRHQDASVIMRVDTDDARVGIGTTSPQEKLHVYHAGTARVEVEGTTGPAAFKATNNQGSFGWYVPSNANEFRLWNFGTSADLVTVDASGAVTAATGFIADAVSASNNDPGTDNVQFSGYGMIGNRGNLYITNASTDSAATVQIGVGGVHNGSPKLKIGSSTSHILTNLLPGSDSTYNIGSNASRFSNIYADTLHGTVALSSEASNLGSFDDRDMAPEDMSFSDDLKLFFVEKSGIEGGTVGSNWQDALFISSYVDASGGNPNLLAFDKSEKKIYHYQASATATSWGTPKELAYTSDFVKRTGGTSTSMSGDLHIIAGAPKIYLQDNTDDDDQQIVFRNNGGSDEYKIATQDFTSAGTGDGLFIGSETTDPVKLVTNDTIALAIDSSQHISLPGAYLTLKDINSHAQIEASSSSLMLKAVNIQAQGNFIPDGSGNRSLGSSGRYWSETYTNGVTSGGNIVINSNTPVLTLGVINSSTGNSKIQFYSKNSGAANGYALQYNRDTGIDRLEFIDGSGTANIKFNNGGAAEFAGSVTATQINTGQGATEVHLMNQNLRTTDDVTFDDLTVTGNLTITGDINSYNVTDLDITDKTITLGKGQDEGHSGGSGLVVDGSGASILWDESNDTWDFNKGINVGGHIELDGNKAAIFDNTNNNNAWYIRNGGSNSATLQFGLGASPGSNIKHTFAGDGSVSFATYVNAATGFRMASGQAIDFISTNIGYNSIERNTTVGGLQINTGDTNSMNILDNGRVGIGTSTPDSKLSVTSTSNNSEDILYLKSGIDNADEYLGLAFEVGGGGNGPHGAVRVYNGPSSSDTYMSLLTTTNGGTLTQGLTQNHLGYIGIATTSPTEKLHVEGRIRIGTTPVVCSHGDITMDIDQDNNSGSNYFRVTRDGEATELFRVQENGNVGVGTNSPDQKLHVEFANTDTSFSGGSGGAWGSQGIRIENTVNTADTMAMLHFRNNDADIHIAGIRQGTDDSDLGFFFEGNEKVRFTNAGYVGIGTSSPSSFNSNARNLVVNSSGNTGISIATTDTNANSSLIFADGTGGTAGYRGAIRYKHNGDYMQFDTSASERMRITSAGNVGIGTTSPGTNLQVNSSTNTATSIGISNTGSGASRLYMDASNGDFSGSDYMWIGQNDDKSGEIFMAQNSGSFHIKTQPGGTSTTQFTVTQAGNVGIGTSLPLSKLHIDSSEAAVHFTRSGQETYRIIHGSSGLYFSKPNSGALAFGVTQNSDFDTFDSSGNTLFRSDASTGRVGIGTTSPTYKLSVSGGIQAGGKITYSKSYGSLNATGNAVAGITADANGNGSSCGFTFTCFGHTGKYQKIVYSCYNDAGTWRARKVIDEGTNNLDVAASADGSTITFTFKATSSTMNYTPRVTVEATGHNINSTYA